MESFRGNTELILDEIRRALDAVDPKQVDALIDALLGARRIYCIAVGRVFLALQAMAKRLAHLGLAAHCVGDINEPAAGQGDLLLVASGSGESAVPLAIARVARAKGVRIAHIGSNPRSSLAPMTDVFVRIPVVTKLNLPGEIPSAQPMTSLFDQALYVFGDAVAMEIVRRKNLDVKTLWRFHATLE